MSHEYSKTSETRHTTEFAPLFFRFGHCIKIIPEKKVSKNEMVVICFVLMNYGVKHELHTSLNLPHELLILLILFHFNRIDRFEIGVLAAILLFEIRLAGFDNRNGFVVLR